MIQIILAIFLSIGPILLYISLAAFSRRFLFDSVRNNESKATNKNINNNNGLCTSPGCIRCNRNKQEINSAIYRFQNAGFCQYPKIYGKIEQALICAKSEDAKLFFEMPFVDSIVSNKPIWPLEELPNEFVQKLALLGQNHQILMEECEKALQYGYLWRRNDEPQNGTSCWFTFSLINQGAWQEQQCGECPKLTAILHQLDSGPLLTDCLFGNVFISLLPANSVIAEHRGLTNARLRVHFGLEVPSQRGDKCFMIVGGKKFHWTAGTSTVIDDSFPHSVSSFGCAEDRIVLVLDFWHFGLNEKEKAALSRIFPPMYSKT